MFFQRFFVNQVDFSVIQRTEDIDQFLILMGPIEAFKNLQGMCPLFVIFPIREQETIRIQRDAFLNNPIC